MSKSHPPGKTHGLSKAPIYFTWSRMWQRCYDPKLKDYHRYAGRGIGVDEHWGWFENFYNDMGEAPEGMTLERINSNKDYGPHNCMWASWKDQARNRRSAKTWTVYGVKYPSITLAAKAHGVSTTAIKRWCDGYLHPAGYEYGPRQNCSSRSVYEGVE